MATKEAILDDIGGFLQSAFPKEQYITLALNALDQHARGADGVYLTVTGLSCESGDSGQVGRGNRVSGLISFLRPQTMEAWAGKNPNTHVSKIYSFAAQSLARRLCAEIPEIKDAHVVLVGKIGAPVREPADIFAYLKIRGHRHGMVQHRAKELLKQAVSEGFVFAPETLFQTDEEEAREGRGLPHVTTA